LYHQEKTHLKESMEFIQSAVNYKCFGFTKQTEPMKFYAKILPQKSALKLYLIT